MEGQKDCGNSMCRVCHPDKHIAFFRCKWCGEVVKKEFNPQGIPSMNTLEEVVEMNTRLGIGIGHHCYTDPDRFGQLKYVGYCHTPKGKDK